MRTLLKKLRTLMPQEYLPIFARFGITLVIRLNNPQYDAKVFQSAGVQVLDLYFRDGSVPPPEIVDSFLKAVEGNAGATAVHCKAGLGRTGTLIAIYAMKHYRFCAADFIAWIRVMRPGSVLGPQQQYLNEIEKDVFALTASSPIWRGLSKEYKEFALRMHKTQEAPEVHLTAEEALVARYGQANQGEMLLAHRPNKERS